MIDKEIFYQGTMEKEKALKYLEDLVKSCKEGKICVQDGENYVTLEPQDVVKLKATAEQDEGKEKFSLKLSWYKQRKPDQEASLKISSKEPKAKSSEEHGQRPAASTKK
jgi:amphi-Trp domain-containing protein